MSETQETNTPTKSLTVYSDPTAPRDLVTLDWDDQPDLDKVRILLSKDATFETVDYCVELNKETTSFTLDLERGFFIQFQAKDGDGWTQHLLDDTEAPYQVTGVNFNGKTLSWDATHDNLGGNGVKQYRVEIAEDPEFTLVVSSETTEGTELMPEAVPGKTLYFRVQAEDFTGNIGEWSVAISGEFDETPPSRPSGGQSTVDDHSVELSWGEATDTGSGTAMYEYRVASDSAYEQIVAEGTTTECSFSLDELGYGTYYWQVRAIDVAGNVGEWSMSKSFATTDTIPPGTPTNLDCGIKSDGVSVSVIWDGVTDDKLGSGVKGYDIELATDAEFVNVVRSLSVPDTEATIEKLANTDYFMRVRAEDNAGNTSAWSEVVTFRIEKDVTPPVITLTGDNTTPLPETTLTAVTDDGSTIFYRIGESEDWTEYKAAITVSANDSYYFKSTDASGNTGTNSITFANIDNVKPTITNVTPSTTEPAESITITATFADDKELASAQYKLGDNGVWVDYQDEGILVMANMTVYLRATDTAGNKAETSYEVTNIIAPDVENPVVSNVKASTLAPTNQPVTVTADFTDDVAVAQSLYRINDAEKWENYVDGVTVSENATIHFKAVDTSGKESDIVSITITNIDLIPPAKPVASADTVAPTKSDVTVTAVFSQDSVGKEFSMDGQEWLIYLDGGVTLSENGFVYFRGTDEAGNISEIAGYEVANIDRVNPTITNVTPSTTEPAESVTITATFADDKELASAQYKLGDNGAWVDYQDDGILVMDNLTVYLRAIDAAGNEAETSYEVTNIVPPDVENPVVSNVKASTLAPTNQPVTITADFTDDVAVAQSLYRINDAEKWEDYVDGVTVSENATVHFKAVDTSGKESDIVSITITNIDLIPPAKPVASADIVTPTDLDVTVSAVFSPDSVGKEFSKDGQVWHVYLNGVTMSENGFVYFRGTDEAGNVSETASYEVTNIDKSLAPGKPIASADITTPTNQTVTVSAVFDPTSVRNEYSINGLVWLTYGGGVSMLENGVVYFRSESAGGNYSEVAAFTVDYIDKVAPDKPIVFADTTKLTNQDVTVTAVYDEDATVLYSKDGQTWLTYNEPVKIGENGLYFFRAKDEAGNTSGLVSIEITNIDKTAPSSPNGLTVVVDQKTATMFWEPSTDDYSGMKEYIVKYSCDGEDYFVVTTDTIVVVENLEGGTWDWSVSAVDNVGNISYESEGDSFTVSNKPFVTSSDIDGNGVSDVMFIWTGSHGEGNYAHGYWMNGTNEWQSVNCPHPPEWENLGCYDMTGDGKADSVLVGNVEVSGIKGAFIGYYSDANDADENWVNIGYLTNVGNYDWKNKVGNLTGTEGKNSLTWHSSQLGALGVWIDGTNEWISLGAGYDSNWEMIGCGDFDGDGKDSVVMSYAGGQVYYIAGLDGTEHLADSDSGWTIRAIGDFKGDGKDDIVAFHPGTGLAAIWSDGSTDKWSVLGQLDAKDWFIVGAGDYNGDHRDDLLVRQYSTGMLGYYSSGDMDQWNTLGYGVDMDWTVIA